MSQTAASPSLPTIAFIGGGNMASAIIGGLIHQGQPASQIEVVEPWAEAREALRKNYGIEAQAEAGPALQRAGIVVWAVKPQTFKDAAAQAKPHTQAALHLSVAAGIRSDSIAQWLGSERVVRTINMPNCTGSMPKASTTGLKIGVQMMISGAMSMKQPRISRMMLSSRKMTSGSLEIAFMPATMAAGTCRMASSQAKEAAEERLQSEREHADSLAQAEFERAAAGSAEEQPADEPAAAGNDEGFFD